MVELSLPHPTIDAIDAYYAAHQVQTPPVKLTTRLLSGCERAGWYAFRWAHPPREFAPRHARANLARQDAVNELGQCLADVGVDIQRVDPKTFMALEAVALDGHYCQKIAGTARGILEAPKKEHFLYLDLQSSADFKQMKKHGFDVWAGGRMENRTVAVQLGMHLLGLDRAFYLVKNKDTDELWSERIKAKPDQAMALLAKGERIRDATRPPARISDTPEWFACKVCPAAQQCHLGQFALRNCRTCLHSSPAPGGAWHCSRHDRDLTIEDQKAGCPNHLYLPGLVPGDQVDADERAETVTYALRDGSEWVDGGRQGAMS